MKAKKQGKEKIRLVLGVAAIVVGFGIVTAQIFRLSSGASLIIALVVLVVAMFNVASEVVAVCDEIRQARPYK